MTHAKQNASIKNEIQTFNDFKAALLIVSLVGNGFVLITIMVAQASPYYSAQIASLF